jgi:hypothetical protein
MIEDNGGSAAHVFEGVREYAEAVVVQCRGGALLPIVVSALSESQYVVSQPSSFAQDRMQGTGEDVPEDFRLPYTATPLTRSPLG